MSIIRSILRGFGYQFGKFIFFVIIVLIIIYIVKESDINWESILEHYLFRYRWPLYS